MKGQINIEFVASAFIYVISIGALLTVGANMLPNYASDIDQTAMTLEAKQISTEILTQPGHSTEAGGTTNWAEADSYVNNVDAIGLADESSDYMNIDRNKVMRLNDYPTNNNGYVNYSKFKTLTDADHQVQLEFIWKPVIDTSHAFIKGNLNPLKNNMLGYYTFEDTTGPVTDYSGKNNDGTNNGAQRGVTGVLGTNGTYFDGSGDYIEIPRTNELDGGDRQTISAGAWFYIDENSNGLMPIISKQWGTSNGDWELLIRDNCPSWANCTGEPPYIGYYSEANDRGGEDDYTMLNGPVSKEKWHHGMFVLDEINNELSIYLDGEKIFYSKNTGEISNKTSGNVFIGARVYNNNNVQGSFKGKIDDVRIYDRVLEPSNVRRIYRDGHPPIIEPGTPYYSNSDEKVHFGTANLNKSQYYFLTTAHAGIHNTTYISNSWDFSGATPLGEGGSITLGGGTYNITTIQREDPGGSSIVLSQPLKTFGPNTDSDSEIVRLDRYAILEKQPLQVKMLIW